MYTEVEKLTKKLYVEQHKAYTRDLSIFDRFYDIAAKEDTYGVGPGYFKGRRVVDIGCGNTAYFQKAMYELGAEHVTCLDLGEDWKPELQSALDGLGVPRSFYTMTAGTASRLPFDDVSFDFVASNGVIMHLDGVDEAERAFDEMARVCAPGGDIYAYVGISSGIVDNYVLPAMRDAYRERAEFREFIDTLTPESLASASEGLIETAERNDPEIVAPMRAAIAMLTLDTITFWQNVLQVPVQQGQKLTQAWGQSQYAKHGFVDVRRTPNVYWQRNDMRRFLAPLHHAEGNILSQLLYGDGHIKLIGRKPA